MADVGLDAIHVEVDAFRVELNAIRVVLDGDGVAGSSPMRGDSGEIPVELPDRDWRYQPAQGVFEPERLDVSLKRLLEIGDRLLFRFPFSVGGDVRDAGGKPTQLGVWNQLDG